MCLRRNRFEGCAISRPKCLYIRRNVCAAASGTRPKPAAPAPAEIADEARSDEYSKEMQTAMGTSQTYRHEDGMNYDVILEDLAVGSCLQTAEDVDRLFDDGIRTVVNLQQDTDMAYFDLDVAPIIERSRAVGVAHRRLPINDFDPYHLRLRLPEVVREMAAAHAESRGTAYVHCTAGMGRAPAVALAFMWWVKGIPLDEAHRLLLSKRRCHPKLYAIRQAAADILYGSPPQTVVIRKRGSSRSEVVEIAGLDVGWGGRLAMESLGGDRWQLRRELPAGTFPYKFVMDGAWSYDADLYTVFDGENTNNAAVVYPRGLGDQELRARERVLRDGGALSAAEQTRLRAWATAN